MIFSQTARDTAQPPQYDIVSKKNGVDHNGYLLHLEDVQKVFGRGNEVKVVLDNVDLRVHQGEFIAVVGPSGCGKSTLLNLILGADDPTAGTLLLDGQPIGFPDPTRGIVDQKYSLFPNRTVLNNVLLPHRLKLSPLQWWERKNELTQQALQLLETAQLLEHKDKYPDALSGGQQQRAAIMQQIANDPKILLMDEPFGALDPGTRERMQTFILNIWEKTGKTIFFVTHDLEEAVFLATRVIVLSQYYTDDRKGLEARGSCIVYDVKTGVVGTALSTKSKLDPWFTQMIEDIRASGFKPDQKKHVRDFDLKHPDSFHTVAVDAVNEVADQ